MSENVTPAQIEAIMRNVVAEENYSITRTFYQIRKKNYIINCDFIQDVLGPMMRSPKLIRTDADIKVAARAWANPATRAAAEITYGHISDWETSQVTNMEKLFCGDTDYGEDDNMQSFNDDISRWDTSKVTTMECMFHHAYAFNGDLSRWDTSNVTTMRSMFYGCPVETKHKPPRCRQECNKGGNDKQGQKIEKMFQKCSFNLAFSFYSLALTYHKFVH